MVNSVVNRSMSTKTFRQKQSRILLHDVCGLVSGFFKRFRMFILLMVQKSGIHHLRVVVSPIIYKVLAPSKRWLGYLISEPSTITGSKETLGLRPGLDVLVGTIDSTQHFPTKHHVFARGGL